MIKTKIVRIKKIRAVKNREISDIVQFISDNENHNTGEIIITILDDEGIRKINKEYLDRDKTTNVITFSYIEDFNENISPVISEIFINFDAAKREGKEVGITSRERFFQLLIHGVLHGFGYEHVNVSDEEVEKMLKKEILYYNNIMEKFAYEG